MSFLGYLPSSFFIRILLKLRNYFENIQAGFRKTSSLENELENNILEEGTLITGNEEFKIKCKKNYKIGFKIFKIFFLNPTKKNIQLMLVGIPSPYLYLLREIMATIAFLRISRHIRDLNELKNFMNCFRRQILQRKLSKSANLKLLKMFLKNEKIL